MTLNAATLTQVWKFQASVSLNGRLSETQFPESSHVLVDGKLMGFVVRPCGLRFDCTSLLLSDRGFDKPGLWGHFNPLKLRTE